MERLAGQALLDNDKTFEGDARDFEARAKHSGYTGANGVKDYFVFLLKAGMDKSGVDLETQKNALPETDFSIFGEE